MKECFLRTIYIAKEVKVITVTQLKAARALLGWTQLDLATQSGMSLAAINKLEREAVTPRRHTLDILQQTLEQAGVEFIEGPGVRLTDSLLKIRVLNGHQAIIQLLNDVFETMRRLPAPRPNVLISGVDEAKWNAYNEEVVALQQIRTAEYGIRHRVLICEGDTNFLPNLDVAQIYRWVSRDLFTQMPYYVYHDKYALVLWGPPIKVMIIQSRLIAETYRRQFEINWQNGRVPKA